MTPTTDYVKTIQPYMYAQHHLKCASQDSWQGSGVSMLYAYECTSDYYVAASDACADIMLYYNQDHSRMGIELVGSHDDLQKLQLRKGCKYFGIRLLPGYMPRKFKLELNEIRNEEIDLIRNGICEAFLTDISEAASFEKQCQKALHFIDLFKEPSDLATGQDHIMQYLVNSVMQHKTNYGMDYLEQESGYTARYLNKVFKNRTGYSVMQFSNIMRAQRVGEYITRRKANSQHVSLVDLATALGYCDESHMIREFKRCFGVTPGKYIKME